HHGFCFGRLLVCRCRSLRQWLDDGLCPATHLCARPVGTCCCFLLLDCPSRRPCSCSRGFAPAFGRTAAQHLTRVRLCRRSFADRRSFRAYDHVERNSFWPGAGTYISAMPCQDPHPGKRFSSNQVDLRRLWLWRRDIAMADRKDLRLQRVLERGLSCSSG